MSRYLRLFAALMLLMGVMVGCGGEGDDAGTSTPAATDGGDAGGDTATE